MVPAGVDEPRPERTRTPDNHGQMHVTLADQIEAIILSGELPAGSKLDEVALARRFDVSRTPVREALRRLASTGLIDLIPNRGAFTATLSADQLHEMMVAMAHMEATCAGLAATAMTAAERRALQRLHDRMGKLAASDDEVRAFGEMDEALHILLYRGTHNRYLEETASSLRKRLSLYRRSHFRMPGRLKEALEEQEAIVSAVLAEQAERAHAAMLAHFEKVEAAAQTLLAEMEARRQSRA